MPRNTQVLRRMQEYVASEAMAERERSLVNGVKVLLALPDVDMVHRRQLVDIALWKYTEASDMSPHPKYNLRFVSDGARNLEVEASLNHEHVWSRRWILDQLFRRSTWDTAALTEFLREHAVACVVTVEEHALLGGEQGTGCKRYAAAGVSVWDRQEGAYLNLAAGHPLVEQRATDGDSSGTASGDSGNDAAPASCDDVWVEGATFEADYAGCDGGTVGTEYEVGCLSEPQGT